MNKIKTYLLLVVVLISSCGKTEKNTQYSAICAVQNPRIYRVITSVNVSNVSRARNPAQTVTMAKSRLLSIILPILRITLPIITMALSIRVF